MNKNILEYEKITDNIYWLSPETVLRFSVSLAKKNADGTRRVFHSEVQYKSKYENKNLVTSVKRDFQYYMSLENLSNKDAFTMLRQQDMILIRRNLNEITKWFDNVFKVNDGRLNIKGNYNPITLNNLPQFKSLKFDPVVITINNEVTPGVRITFLPSNVYSDVTADVFMGFVYIMNTMNMHMVALSMINYLEAPPLGTNSYLFTQ